MKKLTKMMLTLTMLFGVVGVSTVRGENATLNQLEAANGTTANWLNAVPSTYPVDVMDKVIFGSDANSQVTNANVTNYDYIYFEVTDFRAERAVRVFFWDPNQSKRIDYYLKPVADKETAIYSDNTTVTGNGTYCVKIPDGARLQGAKTPWIATGTTDAYFKFSEIYLTERTTPYVELVPYTLVYSEGKAIIPISESHIRATGNVTINYATGEVTNTGSGTLTIYLNNEDLIGATLYHVDFDGTNLEPTLGVTDAVNGEVGGIYNSRFNWAIASDGQRKDKVGAVTALTYNFSKTGTMTFKSIYIQANQLIAETTNKNIADMPYGIWTLPANKRSNYTGADNYKTNNIGKEIDGIIYGHDGNGDAAKYVDLTNCSKIIFTVSSSNGVMRLFYNWSGTDADKPIEIISDFPTTEGTYVFDIDKFKKDKGITFFHLNGIKTQWAKATITSVTVDEYTNVISGSGINRTKDYLSNPYVTSIDATGVTAPVELPTANLNCLISANAGMVTNTQNVIVPESSTSNVCANLVLTDGHPFKAPFNFTATNATYTTTLNTEAKAGTLCLPFKYTIPSGVKAWTLSYTSGNQCVATPVTEAFITPDTPVLLNGSGEATFTGANVQVSSAGSSPSCAALTGVYEPTSVPTDSYVLQNGEEGLGFYKVSAEKPITLNPFRAYLTAEPQGSRSLRIVYGGTTGISMNEQVAAESKVVYDLQGRRVAQPTKGLYIVNGKKVVLK